MSKGGLDYKQLKKEDMHYYKPMTALEILELWKEDLTTEEYNNIKKKFSEGNNATD